MPAAVARLRACCSPGGVVFSTREPNGGDQRRGFASPKPDRLLVAAWGDTLAEAEQTPASAPGPEARTETDRLDADTLFALVSDTLSDAAEQRIETRVDRRTEDWQLQSITIIGYSDRIGEEENNLHLSRERARAA